MSILIFDSGLGGLTVLREVQKLMPNQCINYVADDAGFPYGNSEDNKLIERMVKLLTRLIDDYKPNLIVIACNTATTLAIDHLRKHFSLPFVGIVPAIKTASERTESGLVSVLATPATVNSATTHNLIERFARNNQVSLIGTATLAYYVEQSLLGHHVNDDTIRQIISPCFRQHNGRYTDTIVLACTHYPLLESTFKTLAPWSVNWLNPANAVAKQAQRILNELGRDALSTTDQTTPASNTIKNSSFITTGQRCKIRLQPVLEAFHLNSLLTLHL